MEDRWTIVQRIAEEIFVRQMAAVEYPALAARLAAQQAVDAAWVFESLTQERFTLWRESEAEKDPVALENHSFEPPQGGEDACLVCSKRQALHGD